MNCIRLTSPDKEKLIEAAYHILVSWEGYGDESLNVINSKEEKHNAVTPYARMAGGRYQIDLVLRNNLTTEELPLGVYHPHPGASPHQKGKYRTHRGDGPFHTARQTGNRAWAYRGHIDRKNRI